MRWERCRRIRDGSELNPRIAVRLRLVALTCGSVGVDCHRSQHIADHAPINTSFQCHHGLKMVRHLIGLTERDVISSVKVQSLLCLGLLLISRLGMLALLSVLLLLLCR